MQSVETATRDELRGQAYVEAERRTRRDLGNRPDTPGEFAMKVTVGCGALMAFGISIVAEKTEHTENLAFMAALAAIFFVSRWFQQDKCARWYEVERMHLETLLSQIDKNTMKPNPPNSDQ